MYENKVKDFDISLNSREKCKTILTGHNSFLTLNTKDPENYLKKYYLPESNDTLSYDLSEIFDEIKYVYKYRNPSQTFYARENEKYYAVIEKKNTYQKIIEILQVYIKDIFKIYRHKIHNLPNINKSIPQQLLEAEFVYLNFGNFFKLTNYAKDIVNTFVKKLTNDLNLDRSIFQFFHIHVSYNNIYKHICFAIHGKHELTGELNNSTVYNPSKKGKPPFFKNIFKNINQLSYDGKNYDIPKSIYIEKFSELTNDEWNEHNTYVIIDA